MSRFTQPMSDAATMSGAISDSLTANALTVAGTAGLAGVGVMSLAVTATVLPAQTIALAGTSALVLAAGARQAEGKSILPDFSAMGQSKTDSTASTEAAAA